MKQSTDRIPRWKKWLSYFVELPMSAGGSDYNPDLYVVLRRGRFQLCTANAIYSYDDLYDNFSGAFKQVNFSKIAGGEVLLLGLGLGSIPYMLEHQFGQDFTYTAVEIDPEVIKLASQFTLPRIKSPVTFIPADAEIFVQSCTQKFDLICMDIFVDDQIPAKFQSLRFLQQLKNLLQPDGLLLYNRLGMTMADVEGSRAFFEEKFKAIFPEGKALELRANWVLISDENHPEH